MADYYEILGIDRSAKPEKVKLAYFAMAKKFHPDSAVKSEISKFHEVAEAYKVLSDKTSRRAYDASLLAKAAVETGNNEVAASTDAKTHTPKRSHHRDEELKEYHQNKLKKAMARVLGFSLIAAVLGALLAMVFGGREIFGSLAGLGMGLSYSITKNFNLHSFLNDESQRRFLRVGMLALTLFGASYFVWLIIFG